jgi:hypothetical protein
MRHASLFLVHLTGIYLRWACCNPRTGHRPLLALIDLQREKSKEKSMEVMEVFIADAIKTKSTFSQPEKKAMRSVDIKIDAQSQPSGIPSGPVDSPLDSHLSHCVVLCNFLNGAQRASNYSSQKKAIFFHSPLALGFF